MSAIVSGSRRMPRSPISANSRDSRSARSARRGSSPASRPSAPTPFGRHFQLPARPEVALDPFADHRLRRRPHVEGRIERARHALDDHHGLLQQDQFGPRLHVEDLGDLEQQRQQARHRNFARPLAVDRFADGADRLGEIVDRVRARDVAGLEMHLGDAAIVARDEAVENLGEEAPFACARGGP